VIDIVTNSFRAIGDSISASSSRATTPAPSSSRSTTPVPTGVRVGGLTSVLPGGVGASSGRSSSLVAQTAANSSSEAAAKGSRTPKQRARHTDQVDILDSMNKSMTQGIGSLAALARSLRPQEDSVTVAYNRYTAAIEQVAKLRSLGADVTLMEQEVAARKKEFDTACQNSLN